MTEWGVVGVIVVLVNLFYLLYTPKNSSTKENTRAMTELTMSIKFLNENLNKLSEDNEKGHKRIWEHNDQQDKILNDHETRLKLMESEKG